MAASPQETTTQCCISDGSTLLHIAVQRRHRYPKQNTTRCARTSKVPVRTLEFVSSRSAVVVVLHADLLPALGSCRVEIADQLTGGPQLSNALGDNVAGRSGAAPSVASLRNV